MKGEVTGRQQALDAVIGLDDYAPDYTGLLSPLEYIGCPTIDKETRAYVFIITKILAIEQILPLLAAVVKKTRSRSNKNCNEIIPFMVRSISSRWLRRRWPARSRLRAIGKGGDRWDCED